MADETVTQWVCTLPTTEANELYATSMKLAAMLSHTYGGSGESFRSMNDEAQDSYLWACHDLVEKIEALTGKLATSSTNMEAARP